MKEKLKNVIIFILLLISSIAIVGSIYYLKEYPKQDFDIILFTLFNGVEYTAPGVVNNIIGAMAIPVIILSVLLIIPTIKKIQIKPIKIISNHRCIYTCIILIIAIFLFMKCFYVFDYIKNRLQNSNLFEEYYIDSRNVGIEFPEEKRNLIIIIAESIENTILSKENGGSWEYSIIPELEELATENTNFSNNNKIGGAYQTHGTDYSAGGNVAITAGIPLKTSEILKNVNIYEGNGKYLSGAYTMGEILKEQGYNLEIIMGSDGSFGGRKQYYTENGNYKIFDLQYAINNGYMKEEDRVWWGFSDDDLFKWSKEEILNLAAEEKPFNYIVLTVDTHFIDGYLSPNAEEKYNNQYENVHAHSSKEIGEFVKWLQKQEFYEHTTIVIIGDHLGMQEDFYEEKTDNEYVRTIYNVIINPAIEPQNNKNRLFTSMDMYPTILASIGVRIEGDRLGLGTNLYSGLPTLSESIGYDYLNNELRKNSNFYNKRILGNDYYIMKIKKQKLEE